MLCGLSDSELGTLIVAAAVQVDPRFEAFFIVLNNEVDTRGPSVATTLRLIGSDPSSPEGRRIFDPDGFLCRMGLIELRRQDHPLPSRIVDASERFVRHLLGDGRFDGRVDHLLSWRSEQLMPGNCCLTPSRFTKFLRWAHVTNQPSCVCGLIRAPVLCASLIIACTCPGIPGC